jgi:hypothetical protein
MRGVAFVLYLNKEHVGAQEPLPGFPLKPFLRLKAQGKGVFVTIVVRELSAKITKIFGNQRVEFPFDSPERLFSQL